jgi:thymidylate synthase
MGPNNNLPKNLKKSQAAIPLQAHKEAIFRTHGIGRHYLYANNPNVPEGTAYTYGSRFRGDKDQFAGSVDLLRRNRHSKRSYASTWRREDLGTRNPPCVISMHSVIQDDTVYMTCYLRSNDMFRAWPRNAFGLRKYQKMLASELGCELGPLVIISQSAHVYKENFEDMNSVAKFYKSVNCFSDPRGYYVIRTETSSGRIVCVHHSNCGKILKTYSGMTAREITDVINTGAHPTDRYHISYMSAELMKTEMCAKHGFEYVQDRSVDDLRRLNAGGD